MMPIRGFRSSAKGKGGATLRVHQAERWQSILGFCKLGLPPRQYQRELQLREVCRHECFTDILRRPCFPRHAENSLLPNSTPKPKTPEPCCRLPHWLMVLRALYSGVSSCKGVPMAMSSAPPTCFPKIKWQTRPRQIYALISYRICNAGAKTGMGPG